MAPEPRTDLDRLTAAVDALGTMFAELAVETFTTDTLKLASLQVNRAANMIDGLRGDLARKERDLRPAVGVAPPAGRSLDPAGQRPSRQPERDSSRSELFDKLPGVGDATRRGDLSGDYADTVNRALNPLTPAERTTFLEQNREALTAKALAVGLHEFGVHVRGLVDDFARASELERFQQQRNDRSANTWIDDVTGMTKLFAQFDPETGARVRHAVNREIDRIHRTKRDDQSDQRTHRQVVADAIANLILGARANTDSTPSTELIVLIDLHTLIAHEPFNRSPADHTTAPDHNTAADATATAAPGTTDTPSAGSPGAAASAAGPCETVTPVAGTRAPTTAAPPDHLVTGPAPPSTATTPTEPTPANPASTRTAEITPAGTTTPTSPPGTPGTGNDATNPPPPRPLMSVPPPANPGRCCETSDGTKLPVETVRHLACNAGIIPAVLNTNGVILDFGRSRRLASPEQRKTLAAMYDTCAFTGCHVPFDRCEIHHISPFSAPTNGTTNIDKLIPTCQHDHHNIHDHHLSLTLDPQTRTLTVTHPDGSVETHPYRDRRQPTPLPDTG